MLSEEEKKAIEHFKNYPKNWDFAYEIDKKAIEIVLNLISKLQKESDKKDKVINLMAKRIDKYKEIIDDLSEGNIDCFIPNSFSNIDDCIKKETCYECIKEYFYKKVEKENE